MNAENTLMDVKSTSALKSMMTFGLYSAVVTIGAVGGLMVLLLVA